MIVLPLNFFILFPIVLVLGCMLPNRLYRLGVRWACCYCGCSRYYPLFGRFYSQHQYPCGWGDCCGFCTHGSCTNNDCCCAYSNCPDARPACCCKKFSICFQMVMLMIMFFFATFIICFQCYMLANLCIPCDADESDFQKRYKTMSNNPELNQNLIDQNTGNKMNPETPNIHADITGQTQPTNQINYIDNQNYIYQPPPQMPINQEQRFIYQPPPPIAPYAPPPEQQQDQRQQEQQQKDNEVSPDRLENPYV